MSVNIKPGLFEEAAELLRKDMVKFGWLNIARLNRSWAARLRYRTIGRNVATKRSRVVHQYGRFACHHIVGVSIGRRAIDGRRWAVAVTCGYAVVEEVGGWGVVGVDSNGDSNVSARCL